MILRDSSCRLFVCSIFFTSINSENLSRIFMILLISNFSWVFSVLKIKNNDPVLILLSFILKK